MLRFSDARNFGRTATGLLLFAGPLLLIIGAIVSPDTDFGNSVKDHLKELAAVQAHKGTFVAGMVLFILATTCLMLAAIGLLKFFRGPRGVTLGQVAGVFLAIGSTVSMGWYALGSIELSMVQHHSEPLLNTAGTRLVYATLMHATDNAGPLVVLFILFILGIVIGQILLGIAAIRTRVVPIWAGALIIVSGLGSFFGEGKAGGIISGAITLVALGALGRRILQTSDEEWDAPLVRGDAAPVEAIPVPAPAA